MTVEMLDEKIRTFLGKFRYYQELGKLTSETQEQKIIQQELSEQLMSLQPYLQAFSVRHEEMKLENPQMTNTSDGKLSQETSHLDYSLNVAIHDLKQFQRYLTTRPREQLVKVQDPQEQLGNNPLQDLLTQFSKLGHRSTDPMMFKRPTLCTTLNQLKFIVNTYITQEDQKKEFLHIFQTLASHPEIAPLLSDPLSKFQSNNF
ncbi:MAG: hypothetical protein NPIRA04_30130 [Nitrospirales bacterium]|nr:MAG: hypothetical protein NPIRA04_30130 [Nitrospirales bacterium]